MMKIAIVDIPSNGQCILKGMAGGFGTRFVVGKSLRAQILETIKKYMIKLPNERIGYLVSLLRKSGAEVMVSSEIVNAEVYLILSSIVDNSRETEFAMKVKEKKNTKVGFFGTFASVCPEAFKDIADFVIVGEVENIAHDIGCGNIPEGIIDVGIINNLDMLPWPEWDWLSNSDARYRIIPNRGRTLPVTASRGCINCCAYCPYTVMSFYRERNYIDVVDEIEFLYTKYDARTIVFRDPNFAHNYQQATNIANEIIKRNLKIHFYMETRTDSVDKPLIDLLFEAGLRGWELGIENANEDVIRKAGRKPPSVEHQEYIIEHCHKKGIIIVANYILGLPDDTYDQIRKTIKYAKKINSVGVQFTICTPYPGTPFYEKNKHNLTSHTWDDYTGFSSVWQHPNLLSEDLELLREKAYVEYYYRISFVFRFLRYLYRMVVD